MWPLWYGTDPEISGITAEISPAQRANLLLQYLPSSYTERHFAGCQPERRWQNQLSAASLCEKRSLCTAPHFRKLLLATSCKVFKVIAKCQALDARQNAQEVGASLHLPGSPGWKRRAEIGCSCPCFLGMAEVVNKWWNNELLSSCHVFLHACPSFCSCKIQELKGSLDTCWSETMEAPRSRGSTGRRFCPLRCPSPREGLAEQPEVLGALLWFFRIKNQKSSISVWLWILLN